MKVQTSTDGETQGTWVTDDDVMVCVVHKCPTGPVPYVGLYDKHIPDVIPRNCYALRKDKDQGVMLQFPDENGNAYIVPMTTVIKALNLFGAAEKVMREPL